MDYAQLVSEIISFISQAPGLSVLALAAGIAQLVLKALQTPLADLAGKYKLLIVSLVTVISTILGGLLTGASFVAVVLSGAVVAALQVFAYEVYDKLIKKAD